MEQLPLAVLEQASNPEYEIAPITRIQQQRVIAATARYITLGGEIFSRQFPLIPIRFDLRGQASGIYQVRGKERLIRYNPWIFSKYFDDNITCTVPHEVAHYLTDLMYGLGKIRPHGEQWKMVMNAFGVDARRTTTYDLSGIPARKYQQFDYRCGCREHLLTSRRHNKVQRRQARYLCNHCGDVLRKVRAPRPNK